MQPFVPTFKQIEEEVRKLPADIIKEKEKIKWIHNQDVNFIYETLEEEIANKLIKQI